jgi:CheY-like chemotaxis protein
MKAISVLIVDDDADDKELFMEVIQEINSEIRLLSAADGQEALKVLEQAEQLPDFIFLDLNMPRMDGKECLKRIKSNERLKDIAVIIYSTSKLASDIEETQKLGATFFLTKPTKIEVMMATISFIIQPNNRDSKSAEKGFEMS